MEGAWMDGVMEELWVQESTTLSSSSTIATHDALKQIP